MITTCTRCGNAYDAGSEEQANEPERFCPICLLRQQLAGAQAKIEEYRLREFASYQALGYAPPVNDTLPVLIQGMMGLKARLQDSLDSIERATGFKPGTEPLATWVGRVAKEHDAAQAKCAEMREVLQTIKGIIPHPVWGENVSKIIHLAEHALSTDCGKDWHSPAEWADLENKLLVSLKACAEMRSYLVRAGGPVDCQNAEELRRDYMHALSSDCGSGYVPRAELDRLKAANKVLVGAIGDALIEWPYCNERLKKALDQVKQFNL